MIEHVVAPTYPHRVMFVQGGFTPLYVATLNGHLEVVKALLAAGANKEASSQVSGTPADGHVCTRMCLMSLCMRRCPCP